MSDDAREDQDAGAGQTDADTTADEGAAADRADEEVPRLPRAPFFRGFQKVELIRIGMLLAMLVAVIALARPCAHGVSRFVESFDPPIDAGRAANPLEGYDLIPAEEALRLYYSDASTSRDAGAATTDAAP